MAGIAKFKDNLLHGWKWDAHLTFHELQNYWPKDGSEFYEITKEECDKLTMGYDAEVAGGDVIITFGAEALEWQTVRKNHNYEIYVKIGECQLMKDAKLLVDPLADVSEEDKKIAILIPEILSLYHP